MHSLFYWGGWALTLIVQNFAFTFVSRARNSGSVLRHGLASIFSNGIWFIQSMIIWSRLNSLLMGKEGIVKAIITGIFYTVFTVTGGLVAHFWALRNEKGKAVVGANKKYAQITVEEWELVKRGYANRGPGRGRAD